MRKSAENANKKRAFRSFCGSRVLVDLYRPGGLPNLERVMRQHWVSKLEGRQVIWLARSESSLRRSSSGICHAGRTTTRTGDRLSRRGISWYADRQSAIISRNLYTNSATCHAKYMRWPAAMSR